MPRRPWAEPFKIKVVEHLRMTTRAEREWAIAGAGFNTFLLKSEDVYIDLLTDSGTSAMSDRQWAGMMQGDEAYAGSANFYHLESAVREFYGYRHVIPTHQGRGAEHILSRLCIKAGDVVPGNMYFTTTRAHQELAGGEFADVIADVAHDPGADHAFKGDVDLDKLARLIERIGPSRIPYLSLHATVNMAGGQPISMANAREVSALCRKHGIRVFLDATRAVENCYFIKQREPGYGQRSLAEILRELCSYTDGCTMSGKKDCLVNIGGFLALNDDELADAARNMVVVFEGLHTYGGLAGRDMEAMAIGIQESVQYEHMHARIGQVQYLGELIEREGVPIVRPVGGHGIFLDALRFLPHIPREQFPGQAVVCGLYREGGVRSVEIGSVMFGQGAHLELVRLAMPRRVYTQSHMDYVVEVCAGLYDRREELRGLRIVREPPVLRHFTARFEELPVPV